MALEITEKSHLDHGLSEDMLKMIVNKYKDKDGFFIETFRIPGGSFDSALYGPAAGDPPVSEDEVYYEVRGGRPGKSRMIKAPFRKTDELTVIAGPIDDKPVVLYTAFGGPLAPKEPFDITLDEQGVQNSKDFWSQHALADGTAKEDYLEPTTTTTDDKAEELEGIAEALLNPHGDFLKRAEIHLNDQDLFIFSKILVSAGLQIKDAATLIKRKKQRISEMDVEEIAAVAQAFDESGDPMLQKQAAVLDEILLTIGADPKALGAFKKAEQDEIDRLRARYQDTNRNEYTKAVEEHKKEINVNEAIKAIDSKVKKYRPMEAALSTRYSPDMPGVSLMRVGDHVWQCPITKKIYDFRSGYTTAKGNVVPGSEVSNQTQHLGFRAQEHMNFSTREAVLNRG